MNPWTDGPPAFEHHHTFALLGVPMFLLFLLLLAGSFLLVRRGQFGPPPWVVRSSSPEAEAKKILAERFARGEIDPADFMERASVLNWTPGNDVMHHPRPKKRR